MAKLAMLTACATTFVGTSPANAGVVLGFQGTSQYDNAALGRNFIPPDTMGAIGTTQYMETTNGSVAVYDRTGALLSRVSDNAFWQGIGQAGSSGDQRVLFDHYTNRWIAIGFGAVTSTLVIGVSDTANALGTWKSTAIVGVAGTTLDYPTLGMDNKGVYIGTNNFVPGFAGTSLFSIPKADLFGGAPTVANLTRFDTAFPAGVDNGFAIQGAVNWGGNPGNTASFMADSRDFNKQVFYQVNGVNAAGATQNGYDATTTASVAIHAVITGKIERENWSAEVERIRDLTVTGLAGSETSRTWNGTGTGKSTRSRHKEGTETRTYDVSCSSTRTYVVVNLPRAENRWPVSGTINRICTITITGGPNDGKTVERNVTITFNGTQLVPMTVNGKAFVLDLKTRKIG